MHVFKLFSIWILLFCYLSFDVFASSCFGARLGAADDQSLFIDDTGILWFWGGGGFLELPSKETEAVPPTPVLTQVRAVAAGGLFVLALRQNAEVWGWGENIWRQVAKGAKDTDPRVSVPRKIFTEAKQIAAGPDRHGFAVKTDGSLWAWGLKSNGIGIKPTREMPDVPTQEDAALPTRILPPTVLQVAASGFHTLALVKNPRPEELDGSDAEILMGWGDNSCNQLGEYALRNPAIPAVVNIEEIQGKRIRKLVAGPVYSLALTTEGEVWIWGAVRDVFCRDGTWPEELLPKKIEGVSDAVDIAVSDYSGIAILKDDSTLWIWGRSWDSAGKRTATQIMSDVREIAAGQWHVLALKNDETVWAWGRNQYGQLGDGTTNPHCQPGQPEKHVKTPYCPTDYKPVQVIIPPLDKADTTRLVR